MKQAPRSNQQVLCGRRTFSRRVTEIERTPFGERGRVRINGRDLTARHWHGEMWTATDPWRPYPGGLIG